MDTKNLFLMLNFLNKKEKATRKDISIFLKQNANLPQNRADLLINTISNSPEILSLPAKKRPILKVGRGVYEITNFGKNLCKNNNGYKNFCDFINNAYKKQNSLKPHLKRFAIILATKLKDKIIGEISKNHTQMIKNLALKIIKKSGLKFLPFKHIAILASIVFLGVKIYKSFNENRHLNQAR